MPDGGPYRIIPLGEEAKQLVTTWSERALLTLTDMTTMGYDGKVVQQMKQMAAPHKPAVRTAAVMDITGIRTS